MSESDRKADAAAAQRGFGYARPRGRPTLSPGRRKNITSVTMTTEDAMYCQTLGKGNISKGVRICISTIRELEARVLSSAKTPGQVPDEGMSHDDVEKLAQHRALSDNGFD